MVAPCTALSGGELHTTDAAVPQLFHPYGVIYICGILAKNHPNSQTFPSWQGWISFPGSALPDRVYYESVVGIIPGNTAMGIGYQVAKFTHTWSV